MHFDIATAALIGGLTNCVTIRLDNLSTIYKGLGLVKTNHGIGHDESSRTQDECRDLIRNHHCVPTRSDGGEASSSAGGFREYA